MGASDWLSALNFPNSAETTTTVGVDRVDTREPPTLNHIGALQITRVKEWVRLFSTYTAGATRLRLVAKTVNAYGASEYGHYIFDDGANTYRFRAQVKNSGVDTHVDIPASAVTTKGDMSIFGGTTWVTLATGGAGNNGKMLVADSTASSGWALSSATSTGTPAWTKVSKTYTDLSAAAVTNDIEVYSLPAGGVIHGVKIKHSTAFSGGAIASYTLSVGIGGTLTKYSGPAFDVFQAVANTTFQLGFLPNSENHGAATSIRLAATSTGANLNAATAGAVDVWILVSTAT